jgi:NAD(P)-dependent dehydrogenase (short-subunit alcohol dehydrogenase family)
LPVLDAPTGLESLAQSGGCGLPETALKGQVALVTGAGRRIGRHVALRLGHEGALVVVHYQHSRVEAEAVVTEIIAAGGEAFCQSADLTRHAEIETLFTAIEKRVGRLDILVNSAAVFSPTPLAETTEEQWDRILDSNLKAQFFCAQRAARMLRASGQGRIVNFASLGGLLAWPRFTAYSVSKAGVIMLTRCLARSLAPDVTVNAIAPGTISFPEDAPELAEDYIRKAPLARTGTPDDIANAVMYLVQSAFVTGQILAIDGGRSIPA